MGLRSRFFAFAYDTFSKGSEELVVLQSVSSVDERIER